jgi:hypothetical protein
MSYLCESVFISGKFSLSLIPVRRGVERSATCGADAGEREILRAMRVRPQHRLAFEQFSQRTYLPLLGVGNDLMDLPIAGATPGDLQK